MRKLLILIISIFLLANLISAACEENQIDINTASLDELDEIYGVGKVKAQAIIDARPYKTVDDLTNAYGIGEKTLKNIKSQGIVCVEGYEEKEEIVDKKMVEKVEEINIIEESNFNEDLSFVEFEPIELNSKDIKTNNDKDFQDKEDKQNQGIRIFIVFCVLLFLLFSIKIIKNKFRYKNEFG